MSLRFPRATVQTKGTSVRKARTQVWANRTVVRKAQTTVRMKGTLVRKARTWVWKNGIVVRTIQTAVRKAQTAVRMKETAVWKGRTQVRKTRRYAATVRSRVWRAALRMGCGSKPITRLGGRLRISTVSRS